MKRRMIAIFILFLIGVSNYSFPDIKASEHNSILFLKNSIDIPMSNEQIDFGTIPKGSEGRIRYQVTNEGRNSLTLYSESNNHWISIEPLILELRPNQTDIFTITIITERLSLGEHSGSFTIYAPETNRPETRFFVKVKVADSNIDFGNVRKGEKKSLNLDIQNISETGLITLTNQSLNNWITITPNRLTLRPNQTGSFTITVNTSNLNIGQNNGRIKLFSQDTVTPEVTYFIKVNVIEPLPELYIEDELIDFGILKSGEQSSRRMRIENSGGGTLDGRIINNNPWLTVNPMNISIRSSSSQSVILSLDTNGLQEGPYRGRITFNTNGGNKRIDIQFAIEDDPPELFFSPEYFSLGDIDSEDIITKDITIINRGGSELSGNLISNAIWISIKDHRFSLMKNERKTIQIYFDPTLMDFREHEEKIFLNSNAGNYTIEISANRLDTSPSIIIDPKDINFGDITKKYEIDAMFSIKNTGKDLLNGTINIGSSKLNVTPNNFSIATNKVEYFKVTLLAPIVKSYSHWESELLIESNDPVRSELTLPVYANFLIPPQLSLSDNVINFGQVSPAIRKSEETKNKAISFKNKGELPLEISLENNLPWLKISSASFKVDPGSSYSINFDISSDILKKMNQYGPLEGFIHGTSNDPEQPTFYLPFSLVYGILLQLRIGSSTALINREPHLLDVAPQIIRGRTMVPLRFVGETFGVGLYFKDHARDPKTRYHQILLWNEEKLHELFVNQPQAFNQPLLKTIPEDSIFPENISSAQEFLGPQPFMLPQNAPPILYQQQAYLPLSWITSFLNLSFNSAVTFIPPPTNEVQLVWTSPHDNVKRLFHFWYDSTIVIIEYPDLPHRTPTVYTLEHPAIRDPRQHLSVRLYLSLNDVKELFNIEARYLPTTPNEVQLYRLKQDQIELIRLWINQTNSFVIQSPHFKPLRRTTLDVPPIILQGRTLVPLRFIAEAFGAKVHWDGATETITIEWGG